MPFGAGFTLAALGTVLAAGATLAPVPTLGAVTPIAVASAIGSGAAVLGACASVGVVRAVVLAGALPIASGPRLGGRMITSAVRMPAVKIVAPTSSRRRDAGSPPLREIRGAARFAREG